MSVSLSVCLLVRGISGRRSVLIEKMNRSKVVPNFPGMIPTPLTFFRASLTNAWNAFFVFGTMMKCQKEALNRKSEEKQNCLLPRENQHTNMTSLVRHSLTHETRFSFSALWWSARRRLWIEKVKRSKIVCYPEKTNILTWQVSCVTH